MTHSAPRPVDRFASGTAVVTGAGAGIGEGFARHLAERGMTVVVADIDADAAADVAGSINADGGRARPYAVDVADPVRVDAMAQDVFHRHGSVELLVNNAGVESAGLVWEIDVDRWRRLMQINVDGVFHSLRSFVPRMLSVGTAACIANMSSVGGIGTAAVQSPYIVSKHAVTAMTECLYQDLLITDAPIQVSCVIPHSVRSQIFLSAHRDAPTDNPVARAVFDAMQDDNVRTGLDPLVAAAHMVDQIARGEFWILSDDVKCSETTDRRGRQLIERRPPPDPRAMLERMGVDTPKGMR